MELIIFNAVSVLKHDNIIMTSRMDAEKLEGLSIAYFKHTKWLFQIVLH